MAAYRSAGFGNACTPRLRCTCSLTSIATTIESASCRLVGFLAALSNCALLWRGGSCSLRVRIFSGYICSAFRLILNQTFKRRGANVAISWTCAAACPLVIVCIHFLMTAGAQESVGRLGNFPHGIDILTVADYMSVGNINAAYKRVAPFVAGFPEYQQPLAQHLLEVKLRHWEKALRELAARGTAALVATQPDFFATQV